MTAADFDALFAAWRAGDADVAAAYFAPDGRYQEAGAAPIVGRNAIVAHWRPFFAHGPAWRMTVEDLFGADARWAVAYTWAMARADGGWDERPGCAIVHVRDGRIAAWREYRG